MRNEKEQHNTRNRDSKSMNATPPFANRIPCNFNGSLSVECQPNILVRATSEQLFNATTDPLQQNERAAMRG